jgi:hypothetical protein
MNTPLEVMAAIVANGGPVKSWVRDDDTEDWYEHNTTGIRFGHSFPFITDSNSWKQCSLTNPHPQYKPIPKEWTNDWAECRAVDADGKLWEYANSFDKMEMRGSFWQRTTPFRDRMVGCVSEGHDHTNWQDSLEQRPSKMRPMTPLEAYEFLAQGHEGKPRVWRIDDYDEETWYAFSNWSNLCGVQHRLYANLSDRDGDTLTWREFPLVEDKT